MNSVHQKLARVRKPRVHITYDVETDGAAIVRELPFVVGVMGDYAGDPTEPIKPLAERKFVQIDRDNFNQVLGNIAPKLKYSVPNQIKKDGSSFGVELTFRHLDDFHPTAIVKATKELREMLEMRQRLVDLLTKLDGNEDLQGQLQKLLSYKDKFGAVKALAAKSVASS